MAKGSRRQFITRAVLGFGGYLAVATGACKRHQEDFGQSLAPAVPAPPHQLPPGGLRSLDLEQHRLITAACERILPRDADPGATDLRCADYIDRAMADSDVRAQWGAPLFGGMRVLDRQSTTRFKTRFADARPEEQELLLGEWQQSAHSGESAFFEVLHTLTLEGALGDPTYGGNQGGLGFLLVGFIPPPPTPGVPLVPLLPLLPSRGRSGGH